MKSSTRLFISVLSALALLFNWQMPIIGIPFYTFELWLYLLGLWVVTANRNWLVELKKMPRSLKTASQAYLALGLLATAISPLFPISFGAYKAWIIAPILMVAILWIERKETKGIVPNVIITYGTLLSLSAIGLFVSQDQERARAWFSSPNILSAVIGPIAVFSYVKLREKLFNKRIILLVSIIILVCALILSKSIGGLVAFSGALIGYELIKGKRVKSISILLALLVLAFALIFSLERFINPNNSLTSRGQIWYTTARLIDLSPIFGVGLRGFEDLYPKHVGQYFSQPLDTSAPQPHNLWLSWWLALGLPGLLLLIWVQARLVRLGQYNNPANWSFAALSIHGLVDTPYWRLELIVMFWAYYYLTIIKDEDVS